MGNRKRRGAMRVQRFFLKLLCTVLAVILAAMVGVTFWGQDLMNRINRVEPEQGPPVSLEMADLPGIGNDVINILLIGQDRRPGEERARSDAMILCTFHKKSGQLTMTSFLRDLYVPIPGHQDNRINAAYAAGGIKLLSQTLETNFAVEVDGCIEVDFSGFSKIVDLIGGVTVDLRSDEAAYLNERLGCSVSQGINLLDGAKALEYVRIRSLDADGDFSRTGRQRTVIRAVVDAYRSAGPLTVLKTLDDILPLLTTDMSNLRMVTYALELLPILPELTVVSQRIPEDGTYSSQMIRDMSVLVADMDAARQMLRETLSDSGDE